MPVFAWKMCSGLSILAVCMKCETVLDEKKIIDICYIHLVISIPLFP